MPISLSLTCCKCRRAIPKSHDVYELDAEWQRRFPRMRGTLACHSCAMRTEWWCEEGGAYVPGHIPAAGKRCWDAWGNVPLVGSQRQMAVAVPGAAVLQGGEPYLRGLAARYRPNAKLAAALGL